MLLVENDKGRVALLAYAEKHLPTGEALVAVKDLHARRRGFETRPASPAARLVAREPVTLLRGGLSSVVSYWRVPADQLDGVETHFERGEETHRYEVKLRAACLGQRRPVAVPA